MQKKMLQKEAQQHEHKNHIFTRNITNFLVQIRSETPKMKTDANCEKGMKISKVKYIKQAKKV